MDWTQFNWVDWAFAATLLYGAAMGAVRGLSHELATLIGMVAAVIVTRLFYEPVSFWICERWGWNEEVTRLVAVAALALAGRDHGGVRWLSYMIVASIIFYLWVETVGSILGTSGFFLAAALVAAGLAFAVLQIEKRLAGRKGAE